MVTSEDIKQRLETALNAKVEVVDESHLHAGHEGAKSGGRHYRVKLKSARFNGLRTLARHRLVYDALAEWMKKEIHALAIDSTEDSTEGSTGN
ncbi:MAG: BolA family protein [Limnobacter sp.]|jgi:BolA family transcriptional regulator, general stress-responsive regulator|uniref:BolA family transcriptional regulator n=1 Tax=Limnobacter profundi TaxID=2732163 RepID=A0ABX6N585_9BURK|nr:MULTISPECIES: BolA family protein [unclassified Limnobacter]MAG80341.1 BolA family transcriptional regulator [Sutterellaceae bacterium]MBA4314630.1 BolA family transcriptional regulator [Alcaligenaceae bacterium]MBU0541950.1 BolA family transcriptional regulator [Gammaproteobacteria bacterium]PZO14682.1 MAG: BolA family transcriptional regulator [Betaproteobacteria bacterium]HAV73766.1 BolA family transcriptional regulator [Limnobacter sp.]|tara:strand:- start:251 stop:529 length:279 start_codon:yes stop_codon:yes gene_type:complete